MCCQSASKGVDCEHGPWRRRHISTVLMVLISEQGDGDEGIASRREKGSHGVRSGVVLPHEM